MSNIFSNRFFQGGIAIAVVGIAFFAYQNFTGEIETADAEATTAEISSESSTVTTAVKSEGNVEADQGLTSEDNKTENAVNNATTTDNINTAAEETTNNE